MCMYVCRCSRGLLIRVDGSIKQDQTIRGYVRIYVLWSMCCGVCAVEYVRRCSGTHRLHCVVCPGLESPILCPVQRKTDLLQDRKGTY